MRPQQQLKEFKQIFIKAGETQKVDITLKAEELAYWNEQLNNWEIELGRINILIGSSSEDIKLKKPYNFTSFI